MLEADLALAKIIQSKQYEFGCQNLALSTLKVLETDKHEVKIFGPNNDFSLGGGDEHSTILAISFDHFYR